MKPFVISLLSAVSILPLVGCFSQKPYAQLDSNYTQVAKDEPQTVAFVPQGIISGVNIVEGKEGSEMKISESGVYMVVYAPQIALEDTTKGGGCLYLWLVLNGKSLESSTVSRCLPPVLNKNTPLVTYLTGSIIHKFSKGDIMGAKFRGNNTKLLATKWNKKFDMPDTPSTSFTIVKVSD